MTPPAPVVELPAALVQPCRDFGLAVVRAYAAGMHWTYRRAEKNPELQAIARMAECVACLWAGLDPATALQWDIRPDPGFDLCAFGARLDIKSTLTAGRFLLWPQCKNDVFDDKPFDALALVRAAPPRFKLAGWISKQDFAATRRIAPPGHPLDPGTWHVGAADLRPMDILRWRWW